MVTNRLWAWGICFLLVLLIIVYPIKYFLTDKILVWEPISIVNDNVRHPKEPQYKLRLWNAAFTRELIKVQLTLSDEQTPKGGGLPFQLNDAYDPSNASLTITTPGDGSRAAH